MRNESDAEAGPAGQRMLLRRPAGMERQPAPEWDLSPVREDRDPAPPPPPPSATPSALYRTAFAQECEAIVLRLGTAAQDLEAERLSPLESACAFPGVSFTPAPPPPQPARSRGAEGAAPPRLSSACVNLTYEADDDDDPTTSPLRDEARPPLSPSSEAAVAASSAAAHRTYERELPGEASALLVVTSTPLAVGPGPPGEEPQDAAARGPAGPEPGSVGRPKLSCSFKARLGAPLQRGPRATPKSHGLGGPARGAAGALRGGKGAPGKAPQRFAKGGTLAGPRPSLGAAAGGGGSAAQGQPPAQKQLPGGMKSLSKLPYSKSTPVSTRSPSRLTSRPGIVGSLSYLGLERRGVCRGNKAAGTRLPVRGGPVAKPPYGVLLDAGQALRSSLQREPTARCSQCQQLTKENEQLTKENERLKCVLENYQRIITTLKGKTDEDDLESSV